MLMRKNRNASPLFYSPEENWEINKCLNNFKIRWIVKKYENADIRTPTHDRTGPFCAQLKKEIWNMCK